MVVYEGKPRKWISTALSEILLDSDIAQSSHKVIKPSFITCTKPPLAKHFSRPTIVQRQVEKLQLSTSNYFSKGPSPHLFQLLHSSDHEARCIFGNLMRIFLFALRTIANAPRFMCAEREKCATLTLKIH